MKNKILFKNQEFKEHTDSSIYKNVESVYDIVDRLSTGEYCMFYNKLIVKSDNGVYAVEQSDFNDYVEI